MVFGVRGHSSVLDRSWEDLGVVIALVEMRDWSEIKNRDCVFRVLVGGEKFLDIFDNCSDCKGLESFLLVDGERGARGVVDVRNLRILAE